jgi:hypothetical protein
VADIFDGVQTLERPAVDVSIGEPMAEPEAMRDDYSQWAVQELTAEYKKRRFPSPLTKKEYLSPHTRVGGGAGEEQGCHQRTGR